VAGPTPIAPITVCRSGESCGLSCGLSRVVITHLVSQGRGNCEGQLANSHGKKFPVPGLDHVGCSQVPGTNWGRILWYSAEQENKIMTAEAGTMRGDSSVIDLVMRARKGDKQAWDALVERYAPLIWAICRRYRLSRADAEDAAQRVWLRLVDQLAAIRDPAALGGWLATTTGRECGRVLRAARRPQTPRQELDAENIPDTQTRTAKDKLLIAERHAALREALAHLPPCCQQLIALLIEDPPKPYTQIGAELGIPVGSIGPKRTRCLDKLRRHPAIAALITADMEVAR
jgi:RNA polymerase sigma factor (sigma-70 family)